MVKENRKDQYSCPYCGRLPEPHIYKFQKTNNIEKRFAYKFENGRLKLPLEKRSLFRCCKREHLIPHHSSETEYLDSIKDILSFHIGEEWVNKYIYSNKTTF